MALPPNGLKGWKAGAPARRDDGGLAIVTLSPSARVDGQEHHGQPIIVARWDSKLKTTAAGHRVGYDDVVQHIDLADDAKENQGEHFVSAAWSADRAARLRIQTRNDGLLVVPSGSLSVADAVQAVEEDLKDVALIRDHTERFLALLAMGHNARCQAAYRDALDSRSPDVLALLDRATEAETRRRDLKKLQIEGETPTVSVGEALEAPSTSYWLKAAILSSLERDPVDAATDAELLSAILETRAQATLVNSHNLRRDEDS